ncbi:DUF423 domain-containing protein [Pseudenhygromyxa sp. WMMC2535]|nr:DUF423 domain-containing protein [Pseudenhygromyxa sp. WMMC2535]
MICAGLLGMLAVAAGAFGAHGLEGRLGAQQLEWWQTAARYQVLHALALLTLAWARGPWTRLRRGAALALFVGVVIFSGTLYTMALGAPRILGAVTPLGGLGMIAGWGMIAGLGLAMKGDETFPGGRESEG